VPFGKICLIIIDDWTLITSITTVPGRVVVVRGTGAGVAGAGAGGRGRDGGGPGAGAGVLGNSVHAVGWSQTNVPKLHVTAPEKTLPLTPYPERQEYAQVSWSPLGTGQSN